MPIAESAPLVDPEIRPAAGRRSAAVLPSRWGAGARIMVSDLDAEGDADGELVGELLADRIGFRFRAAGDRRLWFEVPPGVGVERHAWTGRAVEIRLAPAEAGRIAVGLQDSRTLVGMLPGSVRVRTAIDGRDAGRERGDFTALVTRREASSHERFSYAYSRTSAQAAACAANAGLAADPEDILLASAQWLDSQPAPEPMDAAFAELHTKALAVLRQSVLRPDGGARGLAVASAGIRAAQRLQIEAVVAADAWTSIDPATALKILLHVLSFQDRDTGLVPGRLDGGARRGAFLAHPPMLATLGAQLGRAPGFRDALALAYPSLRRHVRGWILHRSFGSTGALCWRCGPDGTRGFEAAMGSSPRFPEGVKEIAGADLNAWILREIVSLRILALQLGRDDDAELEWFEHAARNIRRAMDAVLWDEGASCFPDRCRPESPAAVETSALLLPFSGTGIERRHAARLIGRMRDPAAFGSRVPIPSVALRDPAFTGEGWHGAVRPHVNAWIASGLAAGGFGDEALDLARQTLDGILDVYARTGVLLDGYDPEAQPRPGGQAPAVHDPVLTAAAVLRLLRLIASLQADRADARAGPAEHDVPRRRGIRRWAPSRQCAAGRNAGRTGILAGVTVTAAVALVVSLQGSGLSRSGAAQRPDGAPSRGSQPSAAEELPALDSLAVVEELAIGGDYREAARRARHALEDPDAHPAFRYWLATSLWRLGDRRGAIDAARDLAGLDDERLAPELRAWARRFAEFHAPGLPRPAAAVESTPRARETDALFLRAFTADGRRDVSWRQADAAAAYLIQLGDPESACAVLQRRVAIDPEEGALWSRLAEALDGSGDHEAAAKARATARRFAVEKSPQDDRAGGPPGPD